MTIRLILSMFLLLFGKQNTNAQKLTIQDVSRYLEDNLIFEYNFVTIEIQKDGDIKLKSYDKKYLDPKNNITKSFGSDVGFL
ncbi:MAG: hypothetical protein IPL63_19750 [Saprospiraceae bacterium]|nr:hypothetical protein [Saprospiraceae bacterium]